MIQYIKNNFPIIVLLMIVIGGFSYPFYSGKWIVAPKLNEIDAKCYGIDVPDDIQYGRSEHFCSCMKMVHNKKDNDHINYCKNLINKGNFNESK